LSNNHLSLAECILRMTDHEVLRVAFEHALSAGDIQAVDFYIWICPFTNLYKGLNIVAGGRLSRLADMPLNKSQMLAKINESGYEDGRGTVELLSDTSLDDLQRLYALNIAAA